MNRFQIVLTACIFTAAAAWGQAANSSTPQAPQSGSSAQTVPQTQPAQPAQPGQTASANTGTAPQAGASAATSAKNEISGCMTRGFANYQLSDSATQAKYQIRGNGADFAQHANKVVQIQGVPDPKDSQGGKTIFYASTIKDMGQTCGTPDQMAANSAQPGAAAQSGTNAQPGAVAQSQTSASAQNQPGATAASSSETSQNAALGGVSNSQPSATPVTPNTQAGSSTGAVAAGQNSTNATETASNSQSTASSQQGGTTGAAANATQSQSATSEDKGTPQAGIPQTGAVGTPAGTSSASGSAQSTAANQKFDGCVSGDPNNLMINTNGKDYRLQGDTRSVWKLVGHQVEVTGEDFGGKAIQINGSAKDLGSCKK